MVVIILCNFFLLAGGVIWTRDLVMEGHFWPTRWLLNEKWTIKAMILWIQPEMFCSSWSSLFHAWYHHFSLVQNLYLVNKYSWNDVPSLKWSRLNVENRDHDQHLEMLQTEVIFCYVLVNKMLSQGYMSRSENQDILFNL